jgi:hypothetical protein
MTKLTANQADAMATLNGYVGQKVQVLTSGFTANVNPQAVRDSVGIMSSAALRGLQAKGFIKIELAYWKGATITVLQTA